MYHEHGIDTIITILIVLPLTDLKYCQCTDILWFDVQETIDRRRTMTRKMIITHSMETFNNLLYIVYPFNKIK
jgi:hypothetical protein